MTILHLTQHPKQRPVFRVATEYRGVKFNGYGECPWLAAWNSVRAAIVWFQVSDQ